MKPKTMNKDCWWTELLLPSVEIEHEGQYVGWQPSLPPVRRRSVTRWSMLQASASAAVTIRLSRADPQARYPRGCSTILRVANVEDFLLIRRSCFLFVCFTTQ